MVYGARIHVRDPAVVAKKENKNKTKKAKIGKLKWANLKRQKII